MAEIQDFGEKIGGARKDLWRSRGLILQDLTEMNDLERKNHIKKDNIWVKPNWEQIIAEGTPQGLAYWQNKMRQSIPPRPPADDEQSQQHYVEVVGKIRDAVMAITNPLDVDTFYKDYLRNEFVQNQSHSYYVSIVPEASGIVTNKVLKAAQSRYAQMKKEAERKLFGIPKDEQVYTSIKNRLSVHQYDGEQVDFRHYSADDPETILTIGPTFSRHYYYLKKTDDFGKAEDWQKGTFFVMDTGRGKPLKINLETRQEGLDFIERYARDAQVKANDLESSGSKEAGSKRKGHFVPPQLRKIQRTGPDYRNNRHADSDSFLKDLAFRGGEFGNWLNHEDRQASLDMAYDALRDLARLLQIEPKDLAFDHRLAIAFGARGRGGANAGAAHYEPDRQVINLTKMSGAGCLAHEWGHALDHAISLSCGGTELASEDRKAKVPAAYKELLSSLKYKKAILHTEDLREEYAKKMEHCKWNLSNWIKSVKPRNLTQDLSEKWDQIANGILASAGSFTGAEYISLGRGPVETKPEIELLSQIRKAATNHSIPRDTKRQIAMWAVDLGRYESQLETQEPVERIIKTDFYKGSIQFDSAFSRAAHGYWQSDCEMFARAFDCYIADKIRESGHRSDYLSAYADSFVMPGKDGESIAAIPKGEERKVINQKFDRLFEAIKELGILHDYVEPPERPKQEPPSRKFSASRVAPTQNATVRSVHYEQLSLDEMLFSAARNQQSSQHTASSRQDPRSR